MSFLDEYPIVSIVNPCITFTGNSIPQDASKFWYEQILLIEEKVKSWDQIEAIFKFDYYNSSTLHFLTRILKILEEEATKKKVKVYWYYLETDTDMLESGEDYKTSLKLDIKLLKR